LQAVAAATHELISNNDPEKAMGQAIRLLGQKMHADIISIYKNTGDLLTDGYASQLMRWTSEDNGIAFRQPRLQRINCMTHAFEQLAANKIYNCLTADIEDVLLKKLYEDNEVLSTVALPIFVADVFWGFVSFNDCRELRIWTETELSILTSFAVTLSAAIERHLMDEEMREAREKAEAASVAKSEFMANMSHELRTPMNGVIGFTDLVLTTELGGTQREYLQNVSRSAHNLLNIINDILDFSKIEAGKLTIEAGAFPLHQVVEETVEMLAIKAQEKNLEIICDIDPGLPAQFSGDAVRIRQILINLIGNAIKFTHHGEIIVFVNQQPQTNDKYGRKIREISISVKDTGIGIPQNKIDAIFDSFTQADSSTTRKFGGTGLGLTISKRLASLMDGKISVESEPEAGSTFTLTLPLQVIDETPSVSKKPRGVLRQVLVIDDNVTNCRLMQGIFAYLDIPCKICFNGPNALQLIEASMRRNQPFDLIITDHQMPEMDGITLVREIKNRHSGPAEPFILMLSSLEKTMFQQEAEENGIDKFLSKPVKLNELVNLLSVLFEKSLLSKANAIAKVPSLVQFDGRMQVIVAEDNLMNMALITEVLSKMHVKVISAANGTEALQLLDEHDPALIFMDINMPVMDGFETTTRIRQLSGPKKDVPIIALTADAMKEDKERCLSVGMNDFISKPFRLKEIEAVLSKYLQAHICEPSSGIIAPMYVTRQKKSI
jgi:signal transduction histidine kinase/DNA-binding response OmpR family regulator